MDWNTAIDIFIKSNKAASFTVDGQPLTQENYKSLKELALYFTHANSILLLRKTLFNSLVQKVSDNETGMRGDGSITGDSAVALCCCFEALCNIAQLSNVNHKLGDAVDVSETLEEWNSILSKLPKGETLECKEFTKSLLNELMDAISNRTLLNQPSSILQQA